jgi:hypothetical protein
MMYPNGKQPEEKLEGSEEVSAFLHRWRDVAPDPTVKAALLQRLLAELPERELPRRDARAHITWGWLILRSQTRLVHPATWATSALVIALGTLVTLAFYQPSQNGTELPLVIFAPIVTACGVAFLYGLDADPALELEWATPVSARLILLARLALLFGFNLVITLVGSLGLTLVQSQISLVPLIAAWLAPMTFLSALAFFLSVLFFDALMSVLICLLIWVGVSARHFLQLGSFSFNIPDLLHADYHPALWIAAPALLLIALWIAEREERWTGGTS